MTLLRRMSRFSLRCFLAFLMVMSLPIGWFSMHAGATQRESRVLTKLSEIVGPVDEIRGMSFYMR